MPAGAKALDVRSSTDGLKAVPFRKHGDGPYGATNSIAKRRLPS